MTQIDQRNIADEIKRVCGTACEALKETNIINEYIFQNIPQQVHEVDPPYLLIFISAPSAEQSEQITNQTATHVIQLSLLLAATKHLSLIHI